MVFVIKYPCKNRKKEFDLGKYKIVFSDLDGTLLDSNGNLSHQNIEAIRKMGESGVIFAVATGRALGELPLEVRNNEHIRYYITSNGTALYDKAKDSLDINAMGRKEIDKILSVLSGMTVLVGIHADGIAYYGKDEFENYKYFRMNDYYQSELVDSIEYVEGNMQKFVASLSEIQCFCIFFKYDDEHDRACELLRSCGLFNVTASVEHAIEVIGINAGKGNAIKSFAAKFGVDMRDTIGVGDSKNDITLLSAAGVGLAVKGSKSELLPYADRIICSNNEHIADYILKNFLSE